MNKTERLAAAKKRLAEAKAKLAQFEAEGKAQATAGEKFRATVARLTKRSPLVVANLVNVLSTRRLVEFHTGYGAPAGKKALREWLLTSKDAKVTTGGGYGSISYSLGGIVQRLRFPTGPAMAELTKARKVEDRAKAALAKATASRESAERIAFETGQKITKDQLVDALVERDAIKPPVESYKYGSGAEWEVRRMRAEIAEAETHLAAVKSGAECQCPECQQERAEAASKQAEIDRRSKMAKLTLTCSAHGRKRMPWEMTRQRLSPATAEKYGLPIIPAPSSWETPVYDVPIAYCPGGDLLLVKAEVEKIIKAHEKAQKIAAREAAKAAKRKPRQTKAEANVKALVGQEVAFTCPNCGEDARSEVYEAEDTGDLLVGCGGCESDLLAAPLVLTRVEQREAA